MRPTHSAALLICVLSTAGCQTGAPRHGGSAFASPHASAPMVARTPARTAHTDNGLLAHRQQIGITRPTRMTESSAAADVAVPSGRRRTIVIAGIVALIIVAAILISDGGGGSSY